MRKQILTFLLSACTVIAFAFADSETRNLSDFNKVSISSGINATLVKGSTNKVDIEADGIELEKIKTEVNGNKLKVSIDQKWWSGGWGKKRKVSVVITYTEELNQISSSAGSRVGNEGTISSSKLQLSASSGSNTSLNISAESVSADVSSGASLSVSGSAGSIDVDASSGSSFKGYELESGDANVDASSGASIQVNVSGDLDADVSSGASIKYKGSPKSKNIDKSSGGSVKAA
jgi:hypothetical protein